MSTELFTSLDAVADLLAGLEVPWALIGGLAVSTYTEPRFTRDIDIAISVAGDAEAEQFIRSWGNLGFKISDVIEQDVENRLATARFRKDFSGHETLVDFLFASSGIEPEIIDQANQLEIIPNLEVPVARPGHLFALKLLSVDKDRPQDQIDLNNLSIMMDREECDAAKSAIELIEQRGYSRGRDLLAQFAEYFDA